MTEEYPIYSPRKPIEVALPLDAINAGCRKELNPFLKGHPRSIHLWWARRPISAARAIIFAQLVNDPGYQQGGGFKYGKNKKEAAKERRRLFDLMEELVQWENTNNTEVLARARSEIRRSWQEVCELNQNHPQAAELFNSDRLPILHDPFAGGGTIPMEAQRLGLEAYGSDLNPVAVLINKAMIEIPSQFSGLAPANPNATSGNSLLKKEWPSTTGLAEDVRYYAQWMLRKANERIGHLYPPIEVTSQMVGERPELRGYEGKKLPVIAWIWVRTVKSPNPAFSNVDVPLASSFVLSTKSKVYVDPIVSGSDYRFVVRVGQVPDTYKNGTKATGKSAAFRCLLSGAPISAEYIRSEGKAGRIGFKMIAIVANGQPGKVYLPSTKSAETVANSADPSWRPEIEFFPKALGFRIANYGLSTWSELFTERQLTVLSTLCDLVDEVHEQVLMDVQASSPADNRDAVHYANAIALYMSCGINHLARYACVRCLWNKTNENIVQAFGRQVINMVWDFAEANPLFGSLSIEATTKWVAEALGNVNTDVASKAFQSDARHLPSNTPVIYSTDPPYYDNIGYADLSDFFYVWSRRALSSRFPDLFSTITVPKDDELVATPDRHGGKNSAREFFLNGMRDAMSQLASTSHPAFPATIYYAFKQSETDEAAGTSSTGWATFLEAVVDAGYQISGTWPIRSEKTHALKAKLNALASCVVLSVRTRRNDATTVSRREFIRELNEVLPQSLDEMTRGAGEDQSPVAPVDLSQAIIGPGMAVFSKYSAVLEADGAPMSVRTALQLINRFLAEDDFDKDTQFCLHWFEQYGWDEGLFGEADVLARAKATAVNALDEAGVIQSGGGKVKLLRWSEYPTDWDPTQDGRTPVWEALHHLIRGLKHGGESEAGQLLAGVQSQAEAARQLAYRLYTFCERKGWAEDAGAYNELITSWSGIETATPRVEQKELF